MKTLMGDSPD